MSFVDMTICPHKEFESHAFDIFIHEEYDTITVRCCWCGTTITYYYKERE